MSKVKDQLPCFTDRDIDALTDVGRSTSLLHRRQELVKKYKDKLYVLLLEKFVSLHFKPEIAAKIFQDTLKNRVNMEKKQGRPVDFKVALLDFFLYEGRELVQNPIIIEEKIFEDLQKRALVDELTGLRNYRYYRDRIEEEAARARRMQTPFSLIVIDIDDFKQYNDTYGHSEGNIILIEISKTIKSVLRLTDIPIRFGGDEFVIILPNTDQVGAKILGRRIMEKMVRHHFAHRVTLSGGMATFLKDTAKDAKKLFDMADKALYMAKYRGKNRIMAISDRNKPSH
jgi:diguanylate cyclase (GGDEF)-like protein